MFFLNIVIVQVQFILWHCTLNFLKTGKNAAKCYGGQAVAMLA